MARNIILMSVHPRYAEKLFSGAKRVELRRVRPRFRNDDIVLVYVTAPVKALSGQVIVERIVELPINDLWEEVGSESGITRAEFLEYFDGKDTGVGIYLKSPNRIKNPVGLSQLRELWINFHPPQSYRYLQKEEFSLVADAPLT